MAPLTQSEKFDAARYIRTYVPELARMEEPYIHDPEEFSRRPAGYPRKIVPHKAARERALAALKAMKDG
jgi:deoxyribodipyrimidine photo-lyase